MNEKDNGQLRAPAQSQGATAQPAPAGFEDAPRFTVDKKTAKNEAVLGPFTSRDLTLFGSTVLLFIASLIPMFGLGYNLWNLGSLFFLGLGIVLPLIVTALFVARRLSPGTRIRIGSLSVDQFASVVASFTLAFFFLAVAGAFVPSMLIGLLGALGLFAATVLARWIPFFASDFLGREETPAHVVAREAAVPVQKPRAPKPAKEPKAAKSTAAAGKSAAASPAAPSTGSSAGATAVAPSAVVSAPETQISGVVPGASPASPGPSASTEAAAQEPAASAGTPSAASPSAQQTQAAGVATSAVAADAAAAAAAPVAQQAQAAEQTQAARVPAAEQTQAGSAPTTVNPQVRPQERVQPEEPIGATVDPASRASEDDVRPVHEAFWFAVAQPRTAVDERTGAPAFVIEPGGWVLALEDRGTEFLVQHTDGRLGVLRDLRNIERG